MKTSNDMCPLGITEDTFAAWYDTTLGNQEAQRISDHLPTCEVCQSRLTEYTKLDQALRKQRIRESSQAPWEALQASISHLGHRGRANTRRHIWETMGAVAAAILVIVGFLRVFQSHIGVPGSQPTAVTAKLLGTPTPFPTLGPAALPVPGTAPSWQAHTPPPQFVQPPNGGLVPSGAVSASDGATAYICQAAPVSGEIGVQQAEIWVTHNLGAQWSHASNLPEVGYGGLYCSLEVDTSDSKRLVAYLSIQSMAGWFASDDGGKTWTKFISHLLTAPLSSQHPEGRIDSIATARGKTYALYTSYSAWPTNVPTPTSVPNAYPLVANTHLAVSSDGLRSWQPVDEPILALVGSTQYVTQFWSQVGADGQMILLAEVGGCQCPRPQTQTLWESTDGGLHWSELPAPQLNSFVAQASGSNLSWYICGWSFVTPLNSEMACSMDGGTTWSARPLLRTCETCPPIPFLGARICITSDGSLLALDQRYPSWFLYRLPAHSSQWQYLGQLPDEDFDMSLIFAPAPSSAGGGYLWLLSSYGMTGKFFTATEPA